MNRQATILSVIIVLCIALLGCGSSERTDLTHHKTASISMEKQVMVGMPNPAAVYCVRLGYKYKIVTDEKGNQRGICVFPDGSECGDWDFYRGKKSQEWSYCKLRGYDLKDLDQSEGWFKGAICLDNTTKKEIGTVFDLFLERFLNEPLPEAENIRR